jgi:hypothetical protein
MISQLDNKRENRTSLVAGFVPAMTTLGFVIAMLIAFLTSYMNPQQPAQREVLVFMSRHFVWLWPFGIMTMVDSSNPFIALLILFLSAILNACLYGLLGLVIVAASKKLKVKSKG